MKPAPLLLAVMEGVPQPATSMALLYDSYFAFM